MTRPDLAPDPAQAEHILRGQIAALETRLGETQKLLRDQITALEARHGETVKDLGTTRAALRDAQATAEDQSVRAITAEQRHAESAAEVRAVKDELTAVRGDLHNVREHHYASLAGILQSQETRASTDAGLLSSLRDAGILTASNDRVVLHVGFGHSATTSLQTAFFALRDDLFYAGIPYREAGGFFSYLKYTDDHLLDPAEMLRLCRDTVYASPARRGRPIVVSDEMFTEPAEVYYHPHILPGAQVAARLKRFFPTARVLVTVRGQLDYIPSMYFNLKRNYGFLAGMPIPPFEEWWDGVTRTQVRGPYLVNLDYAPLVRVYADLFGWENLLVLPLEELKAKGDRAYLEKLCRFIGIPFGDADVERFRRPRNERMTVVEERVAELIAARHTEPIARHALENESLAGLMTAAPRASLRLTDEVVAEVGRTVSSGNRWLAEEFDLPLGEWGYPVELRARQEDVDRPATDRTPASRQSARRPS